ncbi:MAG: hypothetical protein IJV43_02825, partial [Oscillospiraceae bacterium]|nr:hypothetical protein [Oscillospiraceae bacterium]
FAGEHGLRQFAGSDAHVPEEVGNGAVSLDVPELTPDAVKAALLNADAEVCGKRGAALCVARSQYTKLKKRRARPAAYGKWLLFAGKCAAEDLFRGGK